MYLSDTDIMDWNNRIPEDFKIFIGARYSPHSSQPTIVFSLKDSHLYPQTYDINGQPKAREVGDPDFKYRFAFSIASNREDEFYSIFEKLVKDPFENYILTSNGTTTVLKFDRNIAEEPIKTFHNVFDKEYIRLEYTFNGKLSSIMAYVHLLETSIEYFSMIWGYDKEGNEYNLLKYKIGNIVSPVDDKSKDFLILDYKFIRVGSTLIIDYYVCEMFADKNSPIIKYGAVQSITGKKLTWSRNNRIDDILG